MTASPLDDIRDLLARLPPPNPAAAGELRKKLAARAEVAPTGELAEQAGWLAEWSGKPAPAIRRPLVAIFAGTHGIASHGVSSRPASATRELVDRCAAGDAAISRLCREFDLGLKVFDLALDVPTADFTAASALDEKGCAATMAFGMEALADGTDLLCLGAFGVGGSTAAAAILSALHGGSAKDWTPPAGDAVDIRRVNAVEAALALHREGMADPLEILRRLGGREFAAIAGAVVAARFQSVPVVLDGPAALAAAAVLHRARPDAVAHCMLAAPASMPRLDKLAQAMGLEAVLARPGGVRSQEPLDGARAVAMLKAAAAVAG